MRVESLEDLKSLFREIKRPIVGIGVNAFNRLGPQEFIPDYRIVCLNYTKDTALIERDMEVTSLEKILGRRPEGRRNSATVLKHKAIISVLNSLPEKPALIIYKVGRKIREICRSNGWLIIGQPGLREKLENKVFFRKILIKSGISPIPGTIAGPSEIDYGELSSKFGPGLVLQLPEGSGGKGTFFVNSNKDMEGAKKRIRKKAGDTGVVVTKFIGGSSPSITGCVTRHGIFCTNLQYQLLDIPECANPGAGSGVFCGHDWTSAGSIPKSIQEKAVEHTMRMGGTLKEMGYRGIFSLDMVLDSETGELYVVECNPRLVGSFPTLTMVQLAGGEIPIMALHILEFLGAECEISPEEANVGMQRSKRGSQLILYNRFPCNGINRGELKPGIYELSKGRLVFKRPSYDLRDLKTGGEFLLTDGVPFRNRVFRPHKKILRMVSLHGIIDRENFRLNAWASERVKAVYKALKMERCQ